jgi:tRNA threonylcarbamoyladenosine biosynthesis protein TsaB
VKLLAVDTALGACSVAVLDGDEIRANRFIAIERGHAELLAPMVDEVMTQARIAFSALDRLAVTIGPGTFTGQRIGLAFMRGLRIALKRPLTGVTTLAVMARQAMAETALDTAAAIHDARREEVYLEIVGATTMAPTVLSYEAAITALSKLERPLALAGTAAPEALNRLPRAALSTVRQPDALWVARLARGMPATDAPPKPLYLRPPDARLPATP